MPINERLVLNRSHADERMKLLTSWFSKSVHVGGLIAYLGNSIQKLIYDPSVRFDRRICTTVPRESSKDIISFI